MKNSLKELFDPETTTPHIIGQPDIEQLIENSKETHPKKTIQQNISEIFSEFAPYTIAFQKGRYSINTTISVETAGCKGEEKSVIMAYSKIQWKIGRERRNKHYIKGRELSIVSKHLFLFGYVATEPFSQEAAEDICGEFVKVTGWQLSTYDLTRLGEYIIMCAARIPTPYNLRKN